MALVGQAVDYSIRTSNKEPEWSSICNNVLDQYLDNDDPFGFDSDHRERCSSNDSYNLFKFSAGSGSEQSHQTAGTSPLPSWEGVAVSGAEAIEARQPVAKEPVDFWTKTLRALEQNAAASERQQQQPLRATKSHPDFLSLGGCPSPPAIPSSPVDQSLSVQRQRSRKPAANGRKTSQARSLSRGRPIGVTKATAATGPSATARKASTSPAKMMTPSRFRSGFKDIWAERIERSPKKYELRATSHGLPQSPPPSAKKQEEDSAAFGLPSYISLPAYDEQLSPLTTTFGQTHIYTPIASPSAINAAAYASNSYFGEAPPLPPNPYTAQAIALNDTTPLFPDQKHSFASNRIQFFDFGFSDEIDQFGTAPFAEPTTAPYATTHPSFSDPFAGFHGSVLPSTEPNDLHETGLGISCDPSLVSNLSVISPPYQPNIAAHASPYYVPSSGYKTMPSTPHRRSASRLRSLTPSPPATDSRARRAGSRSKRSVSRHRRAKSTNSTPRHPSTTGDKLGGGFVNYTPHDSNQILSGVAPSGSSKTKARREKEAADKRRRLSQAAVRAVVEAGGDLDALQKAGLI
ncbi:hypothetical protein LTR35_003972 [Friedmanniomyces endolithicus]|nr:hypothetical protein LTR35_003972 [Friedmanniomyces endolithicus]KAK0300210.1 hypothetical protein LTS00_001282 [Friedmanniomyces endolithicus]KAK0999982.1 hypothetical protein LTR54_008905 [Friedmanniomyces endolithicus]